MPSFTAQAVFASATDDFRLSFSVESAFISTEDASFSCFACASASTNRLRGADKRL